jgi:hypothetical protein
MEKLQITSSDKQKTSSRIGRIKISDCALDSALFQCVSVSLDIKSFSRIEAINATVFTGMSSLFDETEEDPPPEYVIYFEQNLYGRTVLKAKKVQHLEIATIDPYSN